MILLPHLLSDFRFLFHYICGSLFIREPVWLFPLLSYCVSCNGFVVLFFYPELIKSLLPFVMVLVFLLLLVRLVLPFTGLFLSLCGPVLYVGSSCLLSLLPCVGVSLLLCCWFCLLCRFSACLLSCSSYLLSLRPCSGVSLLLCCWVCHLCKVPACFLLAFEVEIWLLLLAVLVHLPPHCWVVVLMHCYLLFNLAVFFPGFCSRG